MNDFFKHEPVSGRPVFSNDPNPKARTEASSLSQNPLLKKLQPAKHYPSVKIFFRKLGKNIARYSVKQPSAIKENLGSLIRPVHSLTVGNLWNHYNHFIKEDKDCPPKLASCFSRMEHDEKKLLELDRMPAEIDTEKEKKIKAKERFVKHKVKNLNKLKVGESRLFLMHRQMSMDQSLNGDLFCTISRTDQGFVVSFTGSAGMMKQFQGNELPFAGKNKIPRMLKFEAIDPDAFTPFAETLVKGWASAEGMKPTDILAATESFTQKVPSHLDDLMTNAQRPDKLFWNIVRSIPSKAGPVEASVVKKIRLRAELLTLYEAFNDTRGSLHPTSKKFRQLRMLFEDVSKKVLVEYRKGNISDADLKAITKRLSVIEKAFLKAKPKPARSIPSKMTLKKPTFEGVSLRKADIKAPAIATGTLSDIADIPVEYPATPSFNTTLSLANLKRYDQLSIPEGLIERINELHGLKDLLKNGTPQEKQQLLDQIALSLKNVDFRDLMNVDGSKNDDSAWWQFPIDQTRETSTKLTELLETIAELKTGGTLSQLDFEAITQMHNLVTFLNARRTGYWINWGITYTGAMGNRIARESWEKLGFKKGVISQFEHYVGTSISGVALFVRNILKEASWPHSLPEEDYDLVFRTRTSLDKIFNFSIFAGGVLSISEYMFDQMSWDLWLRPVNHPHLRGLFKNVLIRPGSDKTGMTVHSPEDFFDDPKGMYEMYSDTPQVEPKYLGTDRELRLLSRLLTSDYSWSDYSAFIFNHIEMLHNPEIRNFFDSVLFSALTRKRYSPYVSKAATIKIQELETALKTGKIQDPDLRKSCFETYIYLNELLVRFTNLDAKSDAPQVYHKPAAFALMLHWASSLPEFKSSLGYANRVALRMELEEPHPRPRRIIKLYTNIHSLYIDRMNIEPMFEQEMAATWSLITREFQKLPPEELTGEKFQPLLNMFCQNKHIPPGTTDWVHQGNLVFTNDHTSIDLKTWEVDSFNLPLSSGKLPIAATQDPFIKKMLAKENLHTLEVLIERQPGTTLYSFRDVKGIATRIELRDGKYHLYKELDSKWIQALDLTATKPKKSLKGLLNAIRDFKKTRMMANIGLPILPFFENNVWIDPQSPKNGYILNASGTGIDFKLQLKQVKKDLVIDKMTDLRKSHATGPWTVGNAADVKDKAFDFLSRFENRNGILLWEKQGKLKRVELFRYGLMFAVKDGKLSCETPPFEGYLVQPNSVYEGFDQALVLEHPLKGKKLLFPEADAKTSFPQVLLPSAKGLGKISLFFHYVNMLSDAMKNNTIPPVVTRQETSFNRDKATLKYTAVNLRAHSEDICKGGAEWPNTILELLKHGSPHQQMVLYEQIPWNEALSNPKYLKALIEFTNANPLDKGDQAAFKVKFGLKLLSFLQEHKRLKGTVKDHLKNSILLNGRMMLEAGRTLSDESRLSEQEWNRFAKIVQKADPNFFNNHITPYFLADAAPFDPLNIPAPAIHAPKVKSTEERIQALEAQIKPQERLKDEDLGVVIEKLEHGVPLLFTKEEVKKLFKPVTVQLPHIQLVRKADEKPYETQALDTFQADLDKYKAAEEEPGKHFTMKPEKRRMQRFIDDKLLPIQQKAEREMALIEGSIESMLRTGDNAEQQLAIFAHEKRRATFADIRLAFAQGNLAELKEQGRLPANCHIEQLQNDLITYFSALSKKNAAENAISVVEKIKISNKKDQKNWNLMSDELHRLLTIERKYDPAKYPLLLVFEAQLGKNLRELPGGLNQLDLLNGLLQDPTTLVQAPTGAGKTAVLSVLESALKANGKNLVLQHVLPPLYTQTLEQTQAVLGDLFNTLVMPLRFNLKMPLVKTEYYKEGNEEKSREVSIFKEMYENLSTVTVNKGCVLTDYTSLPTMRAKFLQICGQITDSYPNVTDIQREHYDYLRKILVLLRNKGLGSMDEFDQPNRPNQKFQLDLQLGSKQIPAFMVETTLEIYEILDRNPALGLSKNLQLDTTEEVRAQAIKAAAVEMARKYVPGDQVEGLYDYFMGENEDILDQLNCTPQVLDCITVCKDQFSTYLKLTLAQKEGSKYKRSVDGSRTVPCFKGEPHPSSKSGTLYEQMNSTIQDYKCKGITEYDLNQWFHEFSTEWGGANDAYKENLRLDFQNLFPESTIEGFKDELKIRGKELAALVNQDKAKVSAFSKAQLLKLKSSGYVIGSDPLNHIDMLRAVSGISATSGDKDSLHGSLKLNEALSGQIKAGMAYRIMGRAENPNIVKKYDPEHPEALLQQGKYQAIIDGAGAFNDSTEEAAKALLASNPDLKQVGYHNEEGVLTFIGTPTDSLGQSGIVFNELHTRGTDIGLHRQARAIFTVQKMEGFNNFAQEEGRLRLEGQTYDLAMPQDQAAANLAEVLTNTICVDALQNANDIYRTACRRVAADMEDQLFEKLLYLRLEEMVPVFGNPNFRKTFNSKPEKSPENPGDYFQEHRAIEKENVLPADALAKLAIKNAAKAEKIGGITVKNIVWTPEQLAKMPPLVRMGNMNAETEVLMEIEQDIEAEVEAEIELERNVEVEQDIEQDQMSAKGRAFYPPRKESDEKTPANRIHPAYSPNLFVTEAFLPFKRNETNPLYRRLPFEHSMYDVTGVYFDANTAIIEDPIAYAYRGNYDSMHELRGPPVHDTSQRKLAVQAKFLGGKLDGYSPKELQDLSDWITASGATEMKRHLEEDILRFRYSDKKRLPYTQLGELFRTCLP